MKIRGAYSFQVSFDNSHRFKAAFRQKWQMYIITSKLNSTLGTISKATGVTMTAKVVSKNSNFCVLTCGVARLQNFEFFLLLNRFARLSLHGNSLLLNFLAPFFHLVPCIWES